MDFPYVRDMSRGEYDTVQDYQLNWKQKRRQFQLMTRCMTAMVERIMPQITTKDCWKISIECVEKLSGKEIVNMMGTYEVEVPFDMKLFLEMDSFEKKKYVVTKIREAIRRIAQNNLFDVEGIENACNTVESLNYVNEWYWKKPVKQKHLSVQVKVLHEVECVTISLVFRDSLLNSCKEKILVSALPDEWVYARYLGKLEWISEKTARLSAKTGRYFPATGECFTATYE